VTARIEMVLFAVVAFALTVVAIMLTDSIA
jgi:hypothetical protein